MPTTRKLQDDELDFKIFVDPSCLSEPMEDEHTPTTPPIAIEEIAADAAAAVPVKESVSHAEEKEPRQPEIEDQQETSTLEDDSIVEHDSTTKQSITDNYDEDEIQTVAAGDDAEETEEHHVSMTKNGDSSLVEEREVEATQVDESIGDISEISASKDVVADDDYQDEVSQEELVGDDTNESFQEDSFDGGDDDADTPGAYNEDVEALGEGSRQSSIYSERKTSLRTEALIQAAARAVVARIEGRHSGASSMHQDDEEVDHSILSTGTQETEGGPDDTHSSYTEQDSNNRRQSSESTGSQVHHHNVPPQTASSDEGSNSQHEVESDDVFSDRSSSARSSIASFDGVNDNDVTLKSPPSVQDRTEMRQSLHSTAPPRLSGVSLISDLSQYDKEDFVPTSRETRIPFRTPSAVRHIQMTSSPTQSVFGGGSPRSSKRRETGGGIPPTISRLGSPITATAQFSPKGRSTPPRFKRPKEAAPLVLLHVTLLPLRWIWADVVNGLDAAVVNSKTPFEPSEQLKSLRDAWRELQDRVGDTVLERGVLLPHPQNDYEVLEERLLEALELPLRRRARILECGHYIGPANDFADDDDEEEEDESEDEYGSSVKEEKRRHWCNTCRGEIRYEALGPGKVFRVQVYASNGLMRAGAWAACWKEMERVDVEVEPIVEAALQSELEKLAAVQMEQEEQRLQREAAEAAAELEADHHADEEEEEQTLPVLEQETVGINPHLGVQDETVDSEQQTLPVATSDDLVDSSSSYMDVQEQRQSSVMPSSPPPAAAAAAMQIAMHASPLLQPSSPTAIRVSSPPITLPAIRSTLRRSPQRYQHSRHHPEPIDMSEERLRRDEERLREIYGGEITPLHLPLPDATTSSTYAEPTSTRPQPHSDNSYIPLSRATPRSPSEEVYERRGARVAAAAETQRRSPHLDLENASFTELLLEAFKVLLRDPKNVAIIVLCLFVLTILMRSPQQTAVATFAGGAAAGPPAVYQYDAKQQQQPDVMIDTVMNTPTSVGAVVVQAATSTVQEELSAPQDEPETSDTAVDTPSTQENADNDADNTTTASAVTPTTSPCTSIISQKTTVRVFETVTETVTVSVVTAHAEETDTASRITETAVPQTVEETVYETETVRVTVSVARDDMDASATAVVMHEEL
ncbi:hypothetical protein B0H66DRAFT_481815 [Apodospora peruviana]|uniref:Pathway-specific nitrogen regulator n=1 Tax=Apodospora peruviana TaxID=516989 RepID=A0AAE0M2F7_9PEZI|nr:hypothetical protein B0H66DRAFT_481815 [Apodospora peruviana]